MSMTDDARSAGVSHSIIRVVYSFMGWSIGLYEFNVDFEFLCYIYR